ncbi:MAG: MFS transporter [Candidatus Eremiobacteraeota bacterium]|nr:MFS transporter [Candidatus Eremiobacteraeota bacterium]
MSPSLASRAFRFVFVMGLVNLFADMTYEGARSATGPLLASLGASATVVGLIAGFGEFIGYSLRWLGGIVADRTRRYWPVAFFGYIVNVACVPLLAFAHAWPAAAALIVGERFGRAVRKPATSAMLAHAGTRLGQGWVFGLNDALDQIGATIGPLIVATVLYLHGGFSGAFGILVIPAVLTIAVLAAARVQYPAPEDLAVPPPPDVRHQPRAFWFAALAGAFWAAGFADFALIAYHLVKTHVLASAAIPITYALAMVAGALAAPAFGRWYDRSGPNVLLAALALSLAGTALAFLGSPLAAVTGVFLWGVAMAAQDSVFPAIVSGITPAERRASAIGAYGAVYGVAWFGGSAVLGALYDRSLPATVAFALGVQLCALPFIIGTARTIARKRPASQT